MKANLPKSLGNGHLDTILPYLFRPIKIQKYKRERIFTSDDDFLDLDWVKNNNKKLVIISHGLESSSRAQYVQGIAGHFSDNGFDALAWNCRGCSGEVNKSLGYYHSGASYDLDTVIQHVLKNYSYDEICLIGFSMGGNITLKYLGEKSEQISSKIVGACAFSTPVCLRTSSFKLKSGFNKVYTQAFLKSLKQKVKNKTQQLKEHGFDPDLVHKLKNLPEFDDYFTAPINGFKDASDYYDKCSAKFFLKDIRIPTLIVNAKNDPFLSPECFPYDEVKANYFLELDDPKHGGHVGFYTPSKTNVLWSERRALEFILG